MMISISITITITTRLMESKTYPKCMSEATAYMANIKMSCCSDVLQGACAAVADVPQNI